MKNLPKISIVLLTYNAAKSLNKALDSVKKQIYPKNKIELIVIDNGSSDKTVQIAKKYSNKVWVRKIMDGGYSNRAFGMRKATGQYVYMILEHDMEFKSKFFLRKMVKPLLVNSEIVGSFTREYPRRDQSWVTRFISYNPVQLDPLFEFLTPSIKSTIKNKENGFFLCEYKIGGIPPTTHMLFRKSFLKKTSVWNQEKDFDHDTIIALVNSGYRYFAYVPSAGDYHNHATGLKELIGKRVRNLNLHYFPYQKSIGFKWLDVNDKSSVLKMIFWVIYVNLIIPEFIRGLIKFIKYRDWVLLCQPIIAITTTDIVLLSFIKNKEGRRIISNSIRNLFR